MNLANHIQAEIEKRQEWLEKLPEIEAIFRELEVAPPKDTDAVVARLQPYGSEYDMLRLFEVWMDSK